MQTLKDKLAAERRTHILEAARSVFAEKGWRGATIRDVARAAGVADGTIYGSFADKHALLLALLDPLDELASIVAPDADASQDQEPATALREALRRRFAAFTPERLEALRVILAEALVDPQLRAVFVERVIAPVLAARAPGLGQDAGRSDEAKASAITAATAAVLGFVILRLLGEPKVCDSWDQAPDLLADVLMGGGYLPRGAEGQ